MFFRLELPIYFDTSETTAKQKADIDYSFAECQIKPLIFYRIDGVGQIEDFDGKWYGKVFSGGNSFTSPLSMDELDRRVLKAMTEMN